MESLFEVPRSISEDIGAEWHYIEKDNAYISFFPTSYVEDHGIVLSNNGIRYTLSTEDLYDFFLYENFLPDGIGKEKKKSLLAAVKKTTQTYDDVDFVSFTQATDEKNISHALKTILADLEIADTLLYGIVDKKTSER